MLAYFARERGDILLPVCPNAERFVASLKTGYGVKVEVKRARNIRFHNKFFKLLRLGFEHWEPNPDLRRDGVSVVKDFDAFRENVLILAGHSEAVFNLDGTFVLHAKSIDFESCDDFEMENVYEAVLQVLESRILSQVNYRSRRDVDFVIRQLMSFY